MSERVCRTHLLFAGRLLLIAILVWPLAGVAEAGSSGTSFSGRATAINATAPVVGSVVLADTGPLASSGGAEQASLLDAGVPGLLTAEVLHATTVGQGDRSRSEASLATVTLTAGGHTVGASFLMARATAVCASNGPSASGGSDVVNLTVDHQAVAVSGQPDQTLVLPDGSGQIVINEQQSARPGDLTVNALHVVVNTPAGPTDVVVASAHADVTCPAPGQVGCTGGDFVTGGGWITTASEARANFAVAGGIKQGAFWGHLQYTDHGTGLKVKGTGVTAYAPGATPTSRHIEGTAEINGVPGTYRVDVADNGEPGGGRDTFTISLSTGYTASATLSGGNIQLHQPCH